MDIHYFSPVFIWRSRPSQSPRYPSCLIFGQKNATTHTPWPFNRCFQKQPTNCLLFDTTLHNSWCLVLVFDYKVMWISQPLDGETRTQIGDQTQHLSKVTKCLLTLNYSTFTSMEQKPICSWKDTCIFIFSFSNWCTNLQRTSHQKNEKEIIMKNGRDFFHRFLESRSKALI